MIVPGKIEESSITRIEFSPNEKYFLINDGNVNCRIYDVISGKEIYKINSGLMNLDQDCQFHFLSNEAIYYLIKTNSPQIRVWNILDNTSKVLYKNVIVSGNGIVII